MSKTVLLPDDLHSKIQESKIMIDWVEVTMSLAKKIELYFDVYKLEKMIDEWTETYGQFMKNNLKVHNDMLDERIRIDADWKNPWLIK